MSRILKIATACGICLSASPIALAQSAEREPLVVEPKADIPGHKFSVQNRSGATVQCWYRVNRTQWRLLERMPPRTEFSRVRNNKDLVHFYCNSDGLDKAYRIRGGKRYVIRTRGDKLRLIRIDARAQ